MLKLVLNFTFAAVVLSFAPLAFATICAQESAAERTIREEIAANNCSIVRRFSQKCVNLRKRSTEATAAWRRCVRNALGERAAPANADVQGSMVEVEQEQGL